MLTVYAQKLSNGDVEIYRDAEKTQSFCTFHQWQKSKPDRRNKWITLNCYRWKLAWI